MRRAAAATITQPAGPDGWTDGWMDGWMDGWRCNRATGEHAQGQAVPHAPRRRSRGFETVQAEHLSEDHYSWNPNSAPAAANSRGPNEKITDMYLPGFRVK